MEWQGFRPFEGNPKTYNPEQGYVTNWNNQSAAGFLAHLNPEGASMCVAALPGQSGFVAPDGTTSPHYQDQLERYTNYECKEENLYKNRLAQNLESVTHVK